MTAISGSLTYSRCVVCHKTIRAWNNGQRVRVAIHIDFDNQRCPGSDIDGHTPARLTPVCLVNNDTPPVPYQPLKHADWNPPKDTP